MLLKVTNAHSSHEFLAEVLIHLWLEVDLVGQQWRGFVPLGASSIVSLDKLCRIFGNSLPHQTEGKI